MAETKGLISGRRRGERHAWLAGLAAGAPQARAGESVNRARDSV